MRKIKQAEEQLQVGKYWSNPWNLVFTNELGRWLARSSVIEQFKKIAKVIGEPNLRFHDLRHTYAVMAIQNGDDIKTIQTNLGHHSAAFTLDVYGHCTDQMKEDSAKRMDDFIKRVLQS